MKRLRVLVPLAMSVWACGGSATSDAPPEQGAGEAGGGATRVVIDDLDPGDDEPMVPEGSSAFFWAGGLGNWFTTDAWGETRETVIEATAGGKACHESGDGDGVGIDLWAQLDHPLGRPVDIDGYSGIAFRARLSGAGGQLLVALSADGGYFQGVPAIGKRGIDVGEQWQAFELPFSELSLQGSAITSIDFIVTAADEPFDLWIDDLSFLCAGPCAGN